MRSHLRIGSFALLAIGGLVVHLAGCEDSSEGTPIVTPGGGDAGFGSDGSTDGSVGPGDGSTTDGGGDGGPSGPVVTSCAAAVRVDTLRGVNGATSMSAAGYGDKWTAVWLQNSTVSPDNQFHFKGRAFDGAALLPEHDFGIDNFGNFSAAVADGTGHAFVQRYVGPAGDRFVYDYATNAWGVGTAFPVVNSGTDPMALAAIPTGGAISAYRDGTNVLADRWLPATSTWTTTGLAGLPAVVAGLRLFVNATGKAAAVWYLADGTGTTISVTTFDGATWAPTKTELLPVADGSLAGLEGAIYANGDVRLMFAIGGASTLKTMKYSAAAGTFDAPSPIGAAVNSSESAMAVGIDAQDRLTLAWIDNGKLQVRRDVGAGLGAAQDLGPSLGFRLDLDRTSSNVTLLSYDTPKLTIRGISGAGTTWTPAVETNVGLTAHMTVRIMSSVVFDSKGKPTVVAMQDIAGAGGLALSYAKCN